MIGVSKASSQSVGVSCITVTAGGEALALVTDRVQAITRRPRLTRVPRAPEAMLGIANVNGTVLPVISLARLRGRAEGISSRLIVFEGEAPCGLLVDEIGAVVENEIDRSQQVAAQLRAVFATPSTQARRMAPAAAGRSDLASTKEMALLAFVVGTQEFALPLQQVREVCRMTSGVSPLPGGDAAGLGNIGHRGELLPVLSLAALLDIPPGEGTSRHIVVLRIGRQLAGLLVDGFSGVLKVAEHLVDPVPPILRRGSGEARIQAICRLSGGRRLVSVLDTEQLVNPEMTATLLRDGEVGEMSEDEGRQTWEQFLAFTIGEEEFALPLDAVEEVVRVPEKLTPLPKAPAFVEGVMNFRGEVLPVIDQGRRFQDRASSGSTRRIVVARTGNLRAGFIVDGVREVLRVPNSLISAAPQLTGGGSKLFEKVVALDDGNRMLLIVSPQELFDRAERDMLAGLIEAGAAQAS